MGVAFCGTPPAIMVMFCTALYNIAGAHPHGMRYKYTDVVDILDIWGLEKTGSHTSLCRVWELGTADTSLTLARFTQVNAVQVTEDFTYSRCLT